MKQHISRYLLTLVALFAMTAGAWADETLLVTIESKDYTSFTSGSKTFDDKVTVTFSSEVANSGHWGWYHTNGTTLTVTPVEGITITRVKFTNDESSAFDETAPFEAVLGDGEPYNNPFMLVNGNEYGYYGVTKIEVYGTAGPEVTYNDAKTTASFEMPASDVTVDYELVRDMTVDVDATIADRIRIKKDGTTYVAVTATELIPAVSDKISGTAVAMTATTDYTVKLQKKVEGDTPWTDATALSVGTFRYVITGAGLYDGEITTTEFQLFEGYEVTVPAGEYATYYRTDDNLKIDGENTGGKLYTITGVSGSTATATEITSANKEMPFLIYNGNTEAKTFLLIPTDTEIDQTFYAGFVGTAEDTNILASSAEQNNYAFNGKQFVWVKTAIEVGANKCWLAIPTGVTSNAREINLVFGNTTGIESIDNSELTIDGWYDLNGRKLQGKPTKKGIYIMNGRKVVVR